MFCSWTQGLGASLIGAGIGSFGGGYISEALGGSYELGWGIGGIVGGIAGGYVYKGIQYIRAMNFLKVHGLTGVEAKGVIRSFNGTPSIKKLKVDTMVYRGWGGRALEIRPWVSPIDYGINARSALSIPLSNSLAQTTAFVVPSGIKVLTGTAAPLFGQLGGGVQWWVWLFL